MPLTAPIKLNEVRETRDLAAVGFLSAAVSLFAACIVVWGMWRGLDLTDEGFYLNWISNPFLYKASYSQFGFLFHPVYVLVGRNLIALRLAGVLLLAISAVIFVISLFRVIQSACNQSSHRYTLAFACSASALLSYCAWIPTPNYDLLNLLGELLLFAGWLQIVVVDEERPIDDDGPPSSVAICALGFAIIALTKPPTAAILSFALVTLTAMLGARALIYTILAGILGFGLFALVMLAIDGSPLAVLDRYRSALHHNNLSQSNHDWAGFVNSFQLPMAPHDWIALIAMAVLGAFLAISLLLNNRKSIQFSACVATLIIQSVLFHPLLSSPSLNHGIAIFSLGALTLTGVMMSRLLSVGSKSAASRDGRYIPVFVAFLIAPIAFAFGTNSSVWWAAVHAGIFWIAAMVVFIVLAAPHALRLCWIQFVLAASSCLVIQSTIYAVWRPYRIPGPLWNQTEWISSTTEKNLVMVDTVTAAYFRTLFTEARAAGFQTGMLLLDMTGTSPTVQYVLGARPAGLPWISGGYPGSQALAQYALSQVGFTELQRAWILTAPSGHRPLSLDVLKNIGLRFPGDYEEVGRARTGYESEIHILWRPNFGRFDKSLRE